MLLPLPLSPTRATISRSPMVRSTPSTACSVWRPKVPPTLKCRVRPLASSTGTPVIGSPPARPTTTTPTTPRIRLVPPRRRPVHRGGSGPARSGRPAGCREPRRRRPSRAGSAAGTDTRRAAGAGRAERPGSRSAPGADRASTGTPAAGRRCRDVAARRNNSAVGPNSTNWPAYMIASRSEKWLTSDMSWVTNRTANPNSRWSCLIRSISDRCATTSSADVGSSMITRSGRKTSAMAIIARCRMPPDSWCG